MERRKFLTLAASSAAATLVAPNLTRAQTATFKAEPVQGTVMATSIEISFVCQSRMFFAGCDRLQMPA
jgi:hypothetical protein